MFIENRPFLARQNDMIPNWQDFSIACISFAQFGDAWSVSREDEDATICPIQCNKRYGTLVLQTM
jgi:hypothetical protein